MGVTKIPAPRGTLIFTAYFLKKYFKKRVMLNKSDSIADGGKIILFERQTGLEMRHNALN